MGACKVWVLQAFDKIKNQILLSKLHHIGVRGRLLNILRSYLSNRRQYVQIGDTMSTYLFITSGVPQGSLLGPLLFLVYVARMNIGVESLPYTLADDTKLLSLRNCMASFLQADLDVLANWCEANQMLFNYDKCHLISFGRKSSNTSLNKLGQPLSRVNQENDLGVILTNNLKWSIHFTTACRKANTMLSLIKRNSSPSLTWHHKLNMCKSMIVTIIMYGSCVCFPSKTDLKTIEQVQRRATDWILGYPNTSYKPRLKTLNILPISINMQIHDVLTLSKIMEKKYNFDWRRFLSFNQPSYNTRNSSLQLFSLTILKLEVSHGNF